MNNYDVSEVIEFEEGLYGFESYKKFLPLPLVEENDNFLNLVSLEDSSVEFLVMNPFSFLEDYTPEITKEDKEKLQVKDSKDLSFYVICVMREELEDSTVNLKCPIAVNVANRKAMQIILQTEKYHFRHELVEVMGMEVS